MGGDIIFTGNSSGGDGIDINNVGGGNPKLDSGGGKIALNGTSTATTNGSSRGRGIGIGGTITSGRGDISLTGNSSTDIGINVQSGTITSEGRDISLTGNSSNGVGIIVENTIASGGGKINLTGSHY
jgi:hypothetical protein